MLGDNQVRAQEVNLCQFPFWQFRSCCIYVEYLFVYILRKYMSMSIHTILLLDHLSESSSCNNNRQNKLSEVFIEAGRLKTAFIVAGKQRFGQIHIYVRIYSLIFIYYYSWYLIAVVNALCCSWFIRTFMVSRWRFSILTNTLWRQFQP